MAWEAVADVDQLDEGDMMVVQMGGQPICVVRLYEDEAVAVHNTCTHQQQPLNEGYLQEDDTLICPAHNSRFDLHTGEPHRRPGRGPDPDLRVQDRGRGDLGRLRAADQRRGDPAQAVPYKDDSLICPAHDSRFDLHTGIPTGVPAVDPIPTYACKIEDGAIWVDFEQQTNDAAIPHKPYYT